MTPSRVYDSEMAQANRSGSEAIPSPPPEGPRVQNGPPFVSSGPPIVQDGPPFETAPPVAESPPAETAPPAAESAPPAVTAPPVVETAPPHVEVPPPAPTASKPIPEPAVPPPAALPAPALPRPPQRSFSQRPVPDLDPMPVTADDFEDEAAPSLFASLGSSRPTRQWLVVGLVALGLAFGVGLFVGRGTARTPASRAVVSEPARAPANAPTRPAVKDAPTVAPNSAAALESPAASPVATALSPLAVAVAAASVDPAKSSPKSLAPFNSKLANTSIAGAAARIKSCKGVSVPPGSASVVVTFATTGRVVAAAVTTPTYSLGRVGACVVSKLKTAQVPPFSGAPETVKKTIAIK
jgi:hypothetical protein